jgi:hypothetical protein
MVINVNLPIISCTKVNWRYSLDLFSESLQALSGALPVHIMYSSNNIPLPVIFIRKYLIGKQKLII